MLAANVSSNIAATIKSLQINTPKVVSKASASALNKSIAQGKTKMATEIRNEYNLSASKIKDRLVVTKARSTSSTLTFIARLTGGNSNRTRSINLINFQARDLRGRKGGGVSVKIRRVGGRKIIADAFIGNKGRTVFTRIAGVKNAKGRDKIKPVQTIDVAQMFNQRRINATVTKFIVDNFDRIFDAELKYYSSRA
ncbi:MAG: hypothetical protein ACAH07_05970 [Methylophilaceae bacterium]|nr:hypothetical protein [Methyloradius sp.]